MADCCRAGSGKFDLTNQESLMETNNEIAAQVGEAIGWFLAIFIAIGLLVFSVYVGTTLWNWHVAPYFALMPIGMWGFFGMCCAFGAFKSKWLQLAVNEILRKKFDNLVGAYTKLLFGFVADCFLLLMGWIAR
jgi:hypothetical protein